MTEDACGTWSGANHLYQLPSQIRRGCLIRRASNWQVLSLLVLAILAIGGAVPTAEAQSRSTSQRALSHRTISPRTIARPVQSTLRQSTLAGTRSIVQPANHQELIIPGSLEHENRDQVVHDEADQRPLPMADNVYDFVTDQSSPSAGRHYFLDWSRADLWIGTSGFTNPASSFTDGTNTLGQVEGSFGFQEGFNFGSQLPSLLSGQVGGQLGMRFIQSNLNGSSVTASGRNQLFATAGLFRRIDYGLQGGVVVDYFRDHWIYQVDLWQLRGELSYLLSPAHEIGFRFASSDRIHRQSVTLESGANLNVELRPMNTYRMFGRWRYGQCSASSVELQLGTADGGGLLLGGLLQNPLSGQLGLETAATYFIPSASVTNVDTREGWNLSMALVWTPGRVFGTQRDYNRPLFEVAGNGSFITTRL